MSKAQQLAVEILKGNRKAIAKAITLAENNNIEGQKLASLLYSHIGEAHIIGITGPGGVGKSTLVEKLAKELRNKGKSVGIIAVDPTSPFSGGAFLGDRIRMQGLSLDEGVFIRSMATRNNPGGLARATKDTVRILDASGKDVVIVETVGAGQSEVNVVGIAQTIVVVLAPGFGDEIQAIKAGMMEIGDIFVINKADQENADRAVIDIQAMLGLGDKKSKWNPPIIKTTATTGDGTLQLLEKINEHRQYLEENGGSLRQKTLIELEVIEAIKQKTAEHIIQSLRKSGRLSSLIASVSAKEVDPYTAAERVVQDQIRHTNPDRDCSVKECLTTKHNLEVGLVQVYTGRGKGKTSAAFGLALRAIGRGFKVYVIQFIKGGFDYGELYSIKQLPNLKLKAFGRGKFITEKPPREVDIKSAKEALELAENVVNSSKYDIVILDEVNVALNLKLINTQRIVELAKNKPRNVELILTGRDAPNEIIEIADLVTEMKEIKHPFKKGVLPRKGIEF